MKYGTRLLGATLIAAAALQGCAPNASRVRDLLEDHGYNHVEIDPTNNDLLMFHFTARRGPDETCRGTVSYIGEGLDRKGMISATCSVTVAER
jgi:hypothetical protein